MAQRPATALPLAAGRGESMRPLTDTCPRPLLQVRGKPLLQWHLEALARAVCEAAVVNTAWIGEQIESCFGDSFNPAPAVQAVASVAPGGSTGVTLRYSHEGRDFGGALETAGGIVRALPHLADVFWVAAGDVFASDFVFDPAAMATFAASGLLAHIWLVPNPAHNLGGDFGLSEQGLALNLPKVATPDGTDAPQRYTFSTIALYRRHSLRPPGALFQQATRQASKRRLRRYCARPWTRKPWGRRFTPGLGRMWGRRGAWRRSMGSGCV